MDLRHFLPLVRHRRYSRRQILSAFHATLAAVAAHRALADAIPSLDLVQTVNGFAVISNQNLAPASRDRVDRLIAAHRSQCDTAISALIPQLAAVAEWRDTPPATTSAPRSSDTGPYPPLASGAATWERYEELHPAIVAAEDRLAAEYISPISMQRLRDEALGLSQLSTLDARLCEALRAHVADIIQDRPLRNTVLSDIVDYIRRHPDTFPEWHRPTPPGFFRHPCSATASNPPDIGFEATADNPGRRLPDAFAGHNEPWCYGTPHRFSCAKLASRVLCKGTSALRVPRSSPAAER